MTVLLGNFDLPGNVEDVLETALVEVHMCVDYSLFQFTSVFWIWNFCIQEEMDHLKII